MTGAVTAEVPMRGGCTHFSGPIAAAAEYKIGDLREAVLTESKHTGDTLDRFFTVAVDPLCLGGVDGYFKRVNPAWEPTLGYTTVEMTESPFLAFVHPDDQANTIAEYEKLAAGADTISFENRYRAKDGSYKWMLWNAKPFPEDQLIF